MIQGRPDLPVLQEHREQTVHQDQLDPREHLGPMVLLDLMVNPVPLGHLVLLVLQVRKVFVRNTVL